MQQNGVIGDEGPVTRKPTAVDGECNGEPFAGGLIGEASLAMAQALGINPDPNGGGVDCDASGCPVTYVLFSGDPLANAGDAQVAQLAGERLARALLNPP